MPASITGQSAFVTTTLVIVWFSVFVLGTTIKPIIRLLKVPVAVQETPNMAKYASCCVRFACAAWRARVCVVVQY
jgi:hypothetical protein